MRRDRVASPAAVRARAGWRPGFLVLTACRSGEVRGAEWKEMDLAGREWRIPPERMKTDREHRVPLSTRARGAPRGARARGRLPVGVPFARGGPLSEVAISALVRQLKIGAVPHGFRSSFRDWAAECSDAPREVCELALAHVNTNAIGAAYQRTDLFERRRALMEQWATFLRGKLRVSDPPARQRTGPDGQIGALRDPPTPRADS